MQDNTIFIGTFPVVPIRQCNNFYVISDPLRTAAIIGNRPRTRSAPAALLLLHDERELRAALHTLCVAPTGPG